MADVTKSYKIPSALVEELINVFGENYQAEVVDENGDTVTNTQTKTEFASAQFDAEIINYVVSRVRAYRKSQAVKELSTTFGITTTTT